MVLIFDADVDVADLEVDVVEDLHQQFFYKAGVSFPFVGDFFQFFVEIGQVIFNQEKFGVLPKVFHPCPLHDFFQFEHDEHVAELDFDRS